MIIRMSQATSSTYSIARTKYAVVICFIHFATTPSTNLSIPLAFGLPPSSPSSGEWKGEGLYRVHGGYSNADPGAVALVSSQSAPEYTLQSLRAIRMSQATSFKCSIARKLAAVVICDATLQPPLLQPSPSPWPPAFPLPLRPSEKERGPIKLCIRDFEFVSVKRIPSVRPAVVQLPLQFNFVGKGSDAYQTVHRDIS